MNNPNRSLTFISPFISSLFLFFFAVVSRKPKIVPKSTIYEVQRKKETDEEFARRLQQEENDALAERQRQSTQLQFDAPASSNTASNRKSRNKNKKKKKKKKKNNTNSTENTFNGKAL